MRALIISVRRRDSRRFGPALLGLGVVLALSVAGIACIPSEDSADSDRDSGVSISSLVARFLESHAPAAPGSSVPNLFVTTEDHVLLSWIEPSGNGHDALRFSVLRGESWSQPVTVVESDRLFVNWADFPSMIALEGGGLAAHWLERSEAGSYAYDVRISHSLDGGFTWSDPVTPHRDGTRTEHGFVSLVPERDGGFTTIWLDGRNFAGADPQATESGAPGPEMTLQAARFSAAGIPGPEQLLDGRTCDCCQTAATHVGDELLVVYRDRSADEIRDIWAVTRDSEGWRDPVLVAADGWKIPGCPVNGPAVAASGSVAAVAWFSLAENIPQVKVAFTKDGGRSFGDAVVIDVGDMDLGAAGSAPLGRIDIEWLDDQTVVVSWLRAIGSGAADIMLRAVTSDGTPGEALAIARARASRSSGFPRMVRSSRGLVLAWTEPGDPSEIRVAVADTRSEGTSP